LRYQRLQKEYQLLSELHKKSSLINIESICAYKEKYKVIYLCRSLIWVDGSNNPSYSNRHELGIYLHKEYPRRPPVLNWLTNIFHPNILPPHKNGGVCIGSWTAAETLDALCIRIGEMLQYKRYNLSDPLDEDAAKWIMNNQVTLPVDDRSFY